MGIIKKGLLGPTYNKTGPVVGRVKGGVNTISGVPRHKGLKRKATKDQEPYRERMDLFSKFLSKLRPMIDVGFKHLRKSGSAANAAYQFNYDHAFISKEDGTLAIDYPNMVLSRGAIAGPFAGTIAKESAQILVIKWYTHRASDSCMPSDLASIYLYNEADPQKSLWYKNAVKREACEFKIELPKRYNKGIYHCYFVFNSADEQKTGNSFYLGNVNCQMPMIPTANKDLLQ